MPAMWLNLVALQTASQGSVGVDLLGSLIHSAEARAMKVKVAAGQPELLLIKLEQSQKSARGVHINDLADYLDARQRSAKAGQDQLVGRPPSGRY